MTTLRTAAFSWDDEHVYQGYTYSNPRARNPQPLFTREVGEQIARDASDPSATLFFNPRARRFEWDCNGMTSIYPAVATAAGPLYPIGKGEWEWDELTPAPAQ